MNKPEKELLIKKDIESIENRVRHAFNQGYEMGMKESRSEIPNTCGDAISRQAVLDYFRKWQPYMATRLWDFEQELSELPPVSPQQRTEQRIPIQDIKYKKILDRLYSWLNDMRYAIAPDDFVTDDNERHDRQLQIDLIDELMEWMLEQEDKQ